MMIQFVVKGDVNTHTSFLKDFCDSDLIAIHINCQYRVIKSESMLSTSPFVRDAKNDARKLGNERVSIQRSYYVKKQFELKSLDTCQYVESNIENIGEISTIVKSRQSLLRVLNERGGDVESKEEFQSEEKVEVRFVSIPFNRSSLTIG